MKLLKGLLSGTCLVMVAAGTGICLYEIYNSFISKEPKNVITYHLATSNTADEIQTTYEGVPSDGFDNSSFSTSDTIKLNTTGSSMVSEVDITDSLSDLLFYTYPGNVDLQAQAEPSSLCALFTKDDDCFYFISDSGLIDADETVFIELEPGALTDAEIYSVDAYTGISILSISKKSLSISIAKDLNTLLETNCNTDIKIGIPVTFVTMNATGCYFYSYGNLSSTAFINHDDASIELLYTDFTADVSSPGILFDMNGSIIGVYTDAVADYNNNEVCVISTEGFVSSIIQKTDY